MLVVLVHVYDYEKEVKAVDTGREKEDRKKQN